MGWLDMPPTHRMHPRRRLGRFEIGDSASNIAPDPRSNRRKAAPLGALASLGCRSAHTGKLSNKSDLHLGTGAYSVRIDWESDRGCAISPTTMAR